MEINSIIKEFLRAHGYQETILQLDAEVNEKILKNNSKTLAKQLQVNKVPRNQQDL